MAVLDAEELYRFYHGGEEEIFALRGVSLVVEKGDMTAVVGPSGSGKSTLLACLAGLDEPDGGIVRLLDRRLTRRSESEKASLRARHIGIMMQTGNLFDHLTVGENILVSMRLARRVDRRWIRTLLDLVGLSDREKALPTRLSGGEAARAALAVALAADPVLLLADEPTGQVDAETERQLLSMIERR
jgi:putative ABC transport system ATP-binding protein